jgi:hypothetical protein
MVTITDRLEGSGHHTAELFFHLAPSADPQFHMDPKLNCSVITSAISTGWNTRVPGRVVIGKWSGQCPVAFSTQIKLI